MTPRHLGQSSAEDLDVERSGEPNFHGDVVERTLRLQAMQEPEALLGE